LTRKKQGCPERRLKLTRHGNRPAKAQKQILQSHLIYPYRGFF